MWCGKACLPFTGFRATLLTLTVMTPLCVEGGTLQSIRFLPRHPDLELHRPAGSVAMLQHLARGKEVNGILVLDCHQQKHVPPTMTALVGKYALAPRSSVLARNSTAGRGANVLVRITTDACGTTNSCDQNATCSDGLGSMPSCTCNEGFYGYGQTCAPLARTSECTDESCCSNGQFFMNNECVEVVDCKEAKLECGKNAFCAQQPGRFTECMCAPFFSGDGHECERSEGIGQLPTCTCNEGYFGSGYDCAEVAGGGGGGTTAPEEIAKYTFGPDTTIKLFLKDQSSGKVTLKLGSCYAVFLDFSEEPEVPHSQYNDEDLDFDNQNLLRNGPCIVLIHRDADTLTTLAYTSNESNPDWQTATTTHAYKDCVFSDVRVLAPQMEPSLISVSVTVDIKLVE
ncbi:hypothetical protein cyc_02814 [Cyclospora cayetanensis]|uniref:EGF-like domain-containing protein n=1 Tax=Cyclospora cayetanensis TaxID=88456 RepID=A0A1D3DAV6_9EIME|nr:hypothetical protein cyc_02814 [Cyclospora cayetanensis]